MAKIPSGVGPKDPQVVVLVGATGDLSKRKLLPGLFHLSSAGFIPGYKIIGVSLDNLDTEGFRKEMHEAVKEFATRKVDESCRSDALDWTFTDSYWIDPQSTLVWRSIQHVGPKGEKIEIETLRPPG